MYLEVLAAEMRLGGKQHLNVLRCGVEDGRKVAGSHLQGLASQTAWKCGGVGGRRFGDDGTFGSLSEGRGGYSRELCELAVLGQAWHGAENLFGYEFWLPMHRAAVERRDRIALHQAPCRPEYH